MGVWKNQPPAGTKIDWSNPLTKGLVFAALPKDGSMIDAVSGRQPTNVGIPAEAVSSGRWLARDYASTAVSAYDEWLMPELQDVLSAKPFSQCVLHLGGATSGSAQGMVGLYKVGGGNTWAAIRKNGDELEISERDTTHISVTSGVSVSNNGTDLPYAFIGANHGPGATDMEIFINGISGGVGTSGNATGDYDKITIGRWGDDSPSEPMSGGVGLHLVFVNKVLSAEEHKRLAENPWQIFKPQPRFAIADVPTDVQYGLIKKPWTKKPPVGTKIDWSNPLTVGMRLVDTYQTELPLDATGLHRATSGNDEPVGVDGAYGNGRGMRFELSDSPIRRYSQADLTDTDELTYAYILRKLNPAGTDGDRHTGGVERSGFESWNTLCSDNNADSRKYFFTVFDSGSTSYAVTSGAQFATDDTDIHTLVNRYKSGEYQEIWLDGEFYTDAASPPSITTRNRTETFQVMGEHTNSIPSGDELFLSVVWIRGLSIEELKSFTDNPWQIFEPQEVFAPFNEKLPELATFENEVTSMPVRPPNE